MSIKTFHNDKQYQIAYNNRVFLFEVTSGFWGSFLQPVHAIAKQYKCTLGKDNNTDYTFTLKQSYITLFMPSLC